MGPSHWGLGAAARQEQVYAMFQNTGKCEFGDGCKFSHGSSGGPSRTGAPRRGGASGAGVCFTFQNTGKCAFGDGCKFDHVAQGQGAREEGAMHFKRATARTVPMQVFTR